MWVSWKMFASWAAFKEQFHREEGPTLVEYGLLVALISLVVVVGVTFLGDNVSSLFDNVGTSLDDHNCPNTQIWWPSLQQCISP